MSILDVRIEPSVAVRAGVLQAAMRSAMIGLLFLGSGFTALGYEVVWFRRFAAIWGSSSPALATVVASFLAGLGIGAWLTGRYLGSEVNCLRVYGYFELSIALLALAIPFEITALHSAVALGLSDVFQSPVWMMGVRAALTFCILGPPCLLMGGTLPLLVQEWSRTRSARAAPSFLYAINTWGAAIGCVSAGFCLLPWLGLTVSNLILAAISALIGFVALSLPRDDSPEREEPPRGAAALGASDLSAGDSTSFASLTLVAALSGFAALALQMTWSRQLSVAFGSSTYGFTATLFVILVGIAVGSGLFGIYARRYEVSIHGFVGLTFVLSLSLLVGIRVLPELCRIVGQLGPLRASAVMNAVVCIGAAGALQFIPATCMGILFPLLIELANRKSRQIGRTVGTIYAANTLGSVAGALVTAEIGFPVLGTNRTIVVCLLLYFVCAITLLPMKNARELVRVALISLAWLGIAIASGRNTDPRLTNLGTFMYGPVDPLAQQVLFFREGPSSNVMVTRGPSGERALRVNGKVDASSSGDMRMQLGLSYFPLFLRPTAREVCIVGFGSGTSAGACLQFPEARVTCCEIEPAILQAADQFRDINHDVIASDRFHAVIEDARSYLQGTSRQFDVILSEPSNPWISGVSALFTTEFYEVVKSKLSAEGIFAQWIQMYSMSQSEYVMVLRTLRKSFPHCVLVRISQGDSILIAANSPLVDREWIDRSERFLQSSAVLRNDLQSYYKCASVRSLLLSHLLLDSQGIDGLLGRFGSGPVNTDLNMRLEHDAPLRLFQSRPADQTIETLVTTSTRAEWHVKLVDSLGAGPEQLDALQSLARHYEGLKKFDQAVLIADRALELDPSATFFEALKLGLDTRVPVADQRATIDQIGRSSASDLNWAGVLLYQQERFSDAVLVYQKLVDLYPDSATAHLNLAVNLARNGNPGAARERIAVAERLDPFNSMRESATAALARGHGTPALSSVPPRPVREP